MSKLDVYSYDIPPELIAHAPCEPRDSARLLIYNTQTDEVSFGRVYDLPEVLPASLIITNDTKVLPARVLGMHKGFSIELLFLVDQGVREDGGVRALVNRRVRSGEEVVVQGVSFTVLEDHEKSMLLRSPLSQAELHALLVEAGETPLPPYITSTAAEQLKREQYQSMFAKNVPSVAAPTASLHFTSELVQVLAKQGSSFANVTLQVGLGTFAPVFEEHFEAKRLHREQYVIPQATIASITEALSAAQPIMAVGTTVVRTLEAAKEYLALSGGANSRLSDREVSGSTELFIYPPYDFTYPDILLTNFHVSRSSLMCLVQAYLDHKGAKRPLTELYQLAIDERMRFYSFGDAMLIL